jgi:hypothetical protein
MSGQPEASEGMLMLAILQYHNTVAVDMQGQGTRQHIGAQSFMLML